MSLVKRLVWYGNISLGPNNGTLRFLLDEGLDQEIVDNIEIRWDGYSLHHGPFCDGKFKIKRVLVDQQVLFCPECGLRIMISVDIKTIGDLRKAIG